MTTSEVPTIEESPGVIAADRRVELLHARLDDLRARLAPRGRDESTSEREAREAAYDISAEIVGATLDASSERMAAAIRIIEHRKPERLAISRKLLDAAIEAQKLAVELREHTKRTGELVGILPGAPPFPGLLTLDPQIAAFTRVLLDTPPPETVPPVPSGCRRVRALKRYNDGDMLGLLRQPGDVFDLPLKTLHYVDPDDPRHRGDLLQRGVVELVEIKNGVVVRVEA